MFFPGFIFDFLSSNQEIFWEERLRYDLFNAQWNIKP